ncbi:MAG: hypothetical protein ACHQ5A_15105, partial [Opitutales bacterium]
MSTQPSQRQRLLLIVAGAGLLLLILDRILFTPLGHLWQAHAVEIGQLQGAVSNGRSVIARASQTRQVWSEMQHTAMARDAAQAEQDLITAFDRWGRDNSIDLGSIKPQWKRGADDRSSLLECRVDATGTLPALSRFLYDLESSPLALRVDSV